MEIIKNFDKPSTFHIPGNQLSAFIEIAGLEKIVRADISQNGDHSVSRLNIKPTIPKKINISCDRS